MRVTKAQIQADIQSLLTELAPWTITRPGQLAALLRDPESDDPAFPSDAYIRLMLSQKNQQDPSEKFCDRFYALVDYIHQQLSGGAPDLAQVLDAVIIRDHYDPSRYLRFATSPTTFDLNHFISADPNEHAQLILALIPPNLIQTCQNCGITFPGPRQQKYHSDTCKRAAARERHAQRKEIPKEIPNGPTE